MTFQLCFHERGVNTKAVNAGGCIFRLVTRRSSETPFPVLDKSYYTDPANFIRGN